MKNHDRRTREQRRADASAWISFLCFLALLLIAVGAMLTGALAADTTPTETEPEEAGRLPGDDTPALERCYLTDEELAAMEVQEDYENEKIEAALLARSHKLENVTVTHYCTCQKCCGKAPNHPAYGVTASGRKLTPYVSVGVDPEVIPLGSTVMADYGDGEIHYYVADDTGSGVDGNHIDLAVSSHQEALNLGVRKATIYWCEEG